MPPSGEATDKRIARSKTKVLAETYRQLARNGIGGVSIDEISRISGISKTTIYRHWPSRTALLIDACSRLGTAPAAPNTGTLKGDILVLMEDLAHQLQTANWSTVYPSIIDAAERDPEIGAMQKAMHKGFMAPARAIIENARARGELRDALSTSDLIAALFGPLFFRRWFSKEKIDKKFIRAIVDAAIR